jgi:hypothetical protein
MNTSRIRGKVVTGNIGNIPNLRFDGRPVIRLMEKSFRMIDLKSQSKQITISPSRF